MRAAAAPACQAHADQYRNEERHRGGVRRHALQPAAERWCRRARRRLRDSALADERGRELADARLAP